MISTKLRKILNENSWQLSTPQVRAFVTRSGGHLGPVSFRIGSRSVEPFSVAPWHAERRGRTLPPIIRVLRGDFFCMPFGGNSTRHRDEKHPVHGEVANSNWKLESVSRIDDRTILHLSLHPRIRPGRVDKQITLIEPHRAIYSRHIVSEMAGPMCFGHHAMLKFPDEPHGGLVSMSRFEQGQVFPDLLERPESRGYSILKPGARFDSLERVPTMTGQTTDLSRYPARRGFEDLVMLVSDRSAPFCFSAVTFPRQRYVWFALKDPRVLRSTILWISNGGRHYPPWNGRHVNVLGIEEVTSYFHLGLAESARPNPLSRSGVATSVMLRPRRALVVNYIMSVAPIPAGFDWVKQIEPVRGGVGIRSRSGKSLQCPLDLDFLGGGQS